VGLCLEPDDEGWKVKFGREEVVVPTEQLLLAGKGFETSKGKNGILVGDWVQWQKISDAVPSGTYGSVIKFDGAQAACKFGDELQFMPPAELVVRARKYVCEDCPEGMWFGTGDGVKWTEPDDDFSEDDVGKISELRLDKVKSSWGGKHYSRSAASYTLHSRSGFKEGDQVVWYKSDDDIPRGAVGTVIGLMDPQFSKLQAAGIIRVEFPKGAWTFRPHLLSISTGEEEEEEPVEDREAFCEKYALIVGCTYLGLKGQLNGVARDVYNTYDWVQKPPLSIPAENIVVLSDDPKCAKYCNATGKPTQLNMKKAMRDLALKSGPGTLQFMQYSGHGGNIPGSEDSHENEVSAKSGRKKDQALIPINHKEPGLDDYGCIRDNWILEKFLMPMHKDSTCIFIADCCHSGTIADLPFEYCLEPSPHTKRISPLLPQADVFLFSGCRDAQCSQDYGERVGGALTSNLLPMLSGWAKHNGGNPPVQDVLTRIRKKVNERAKTQCPVISSSVEVWGSFQIPLDKPRGKYAGDARGFDDDLEDLEDDEEGGLDFTDDAIDGAEIEGWDEAEMEDVEEEEVEGWEDDEGIWDDFEPPEGKGSVI